MISEFKIMAHSRTYLIVAAVLSALCILILLIQGLNWGIDFQGGTLLEREFEAPVTVAQVRDALSSPDLDQFQLGESFVQPLEDSSSTQTIMIIRTRAFDNAEAIHAIDRTLEEQFGEVTVRRTEVVGPVIGQELIRNAIWALVLGAIGIMIYLSFRFEYRFGIAAVVAIVFNVIVTLGAVSLLGREINSPFIAAILTVVGYSVNDTIVIFDRIRENLNLRKRGSLENLVNVSINQSLSRSINTGVTTLAVIVILYFFGGATLKDFTFTLLVGVTIGVFSSIFIAGPVWLLLRDAKGTKRATSAAS